MQIGTKGLFDHHPVHRVAPVTQMIIMQTLHDGRKVLRRDCEEIKAHRSRAVEPFFLFQPGAQISIAALVINKGHLSVTQMRDKIGQMRFIDPGAGELRDRSPRVRPVAFIIHGAAAYTDNGGLLRQTLFTHQMVKRRQQLAVGQIAGAAKDDHQQCVFLGLFFSLVHYCLLLQPVVFTKARSFGTIYP